MAAVPPPAAPRTVGERCLIGWMSRADAVKHLTEEAIDPRFDEQSAAEAWEDYHNRVQQLPERNTIAPDRLPLTADERAIRDTFMRHHRGDQSVRDVIKIDPSRCVVLGHQWWIITERVEMYAATVRSAKDKHRRSLGIGEPVSHNLTTLPADNAIRLALPHAEFRVALTPNGLEIQQAARHISVTAFENRLLLFAGYHRSFALSALHNPEPIARSLVVVLTTDADSLVSPTSPYQALRDMARADRPPLFADFFEDRLCMSLRVRKRRPELWVQGQIKWSDDPS